MTAWRTDMDAPASGPGLALEVERLRALYRLTETVAGGRGGQAVHEQALAALEGAFGVERSAILLADAAGVMRFEAWHGLSAAYRAAVEGHSPWPRDAVDPQPVVVADALGDPGLAGYRDLFTAEGIGALLFVPICFAGALLGKFMVYFPAPRAVAPDDLELAQTVARHVAVAVDRARTDAALARSRDDLERVLQAVVDGVMAQDAAGRITFINEAAARQCGFASVEEMRALPVQEVLDRFALFDEAGAPLPHDRLPARIAIREGRAAEQVIRFRINATGEERWATTTATPVLDATGAPRSAVSVFRDITEQRRAEQASRFLAEASAQLASSLDEATTLHHLARLSVPGVADWFAVELLVDGGSATEQVAVGHVDPDKVALARELRRRYPPDPQAPHGALHVLRTGEPELYPEVTPALLDAAARDARHRELLRALELRSAMVVPMIARSRTLGAITFVSTHPTRRYGPADLAMALDLAARAALAVDNARLYAEVRRADERKTEFLTMLAHELRNPLAPVVTAAQLARLRRGEPAALERSLDVIDRQVGHMARLVDDLLDVSRLTRGRFELKRAPLDLAELVRSSADDHVGLAAQRGLMLEVDVAAGALPVVGDPTRLAQVLGNLLHNAFKFTEAGGVVTLTARAVDAQAVVSLRDSGCGMSPDVLRDVLEPFVQGDRALARSRGGLGLGLALARGIVAMHEGCIQVESEGEGLGTRVTFRLPLAPSARSAPGAASARPEAAARRRVVVIEDNVDTGDMLRALLELHGHEVEVARSGPEGLELVDRRRPDLVLCDIGLPGLDGYEVAARLRRDHGPELPLVAVSGYAQDADRARAHLAGFDRHLTKPVSPDDLVAALSDLTGAGAAASSTSPT